MALDFPASPSNGQIFSSGGISWTFDGEKWKISSSGIEPVFISSSTPTGVAGQIYWDSDESTAYIYYDDGNTAQWVPLVSTAPVSFDTSAIVSGTLPVARGGTGTTSFDAGKIAEGNTEAEVVDTGSDGHFKVTTEGVEALRVDSSGNLGIGTTSPSAKLQVNGVGDIIVSQSTAGQAANLFLGKGGSSKVFSVDDSGNVAIGSNLDNAATTNITLNTNGTAHFAGNVGFGLNNPAVKAHISNGYSAPTGGFDSNIFLAVTNNTSAGSSAGIALNTGTDGAAFIHFGDTADTNVASIVYTNDDNGMRFTTNASERMRIDSTGRTILHGTTGNGTLVAETTQGAASNKNIIVGGHSATSIDSGTASFVVLSNGNVVNTNNSYGALSDVKLKENIVDASSQWDDIKAVQVRNYNLKESIGQQTHTQLGVVAQEIEAVSPGLVSESPDLDADGNDLGTVTKSVNYSVLYMKSVKALQEAMDRIETLEAKVAALEAE